MWQKSYSTTIQGLEPHQIWKIWSDVPNRPKGDDDTEWAKADGPFENGTTITMKPKGWPKTVTMRIIECIPNQSFTDYTKFLLAGLYGTHHMEKTDNGLKLTTTIKRDVKYLAANDAPIRPLIPQLSFILDKTRWGSAFRFGILKIPRDDFIIIATAMGLTHEQIHELFV